MAANSRPQITEPPLAVPGTRSPEENLNRKIVALLEDDGRMPFSEIAQRLSVSEGTIRNRVAAMKDAGMLKIIAIVDPVAAEYQTDAMIALNVAAGCHPDSVGQRLGDDERVVYVLWVAGRFDLLVEVVSDDRADFLDFLEKQIHGAEDIAQSEVLFGLKNLKNQFLLKRDWENRYARRR